MTASRRRRIPPTDPDLRIQQRLAEVEQAPPPYSNMQTSDGSALRIVRGVGSGGGAVTSGGGWGVSRFSAGVYIITWTVAFSAAPTVIANVYTGNVGYGTLVQPNPSTTGCQIQTFNSGLTMTDLPYGFIAIGPA